MTYAASIIEIEPQFYRCWKQVCNKLDKDADGMAVREYFAKKYSIRLIPVTGHRYQGLQNWGWSTVVFPSKESFVLFMLEWS